MTSNGASGRLRYSIEAWRADPGATYRSWFLWEERLKNFRSIRRGIEQVVRQIEDGSFGNVYKGSSLEVAVKSVAEQRQIFKGADHAFLWKPKLRIPDIYEDADNQRAFGRFLDTRACCSTEEQVLEAVGALDTRRIKGLGPEAANLLYFLHPTIASPFNTAIVKGYNAVTGSKVKLGSWPDYLAMRAGVLRLNAQHRDLLSNDLGAIAGFMFDVGTGRYPAPPLEGADGIAAWERDLAEVREKAAVQVPGRETETDRTHTEMQGLLRDIGLGLGYDVWIASNDRNRAYGGGPTVGRMRRRSPVIRGIGGDRRRQAHRRALAGQARRNHPCRIRGRAHHVDLLGHRQDAKSCAGPLRQSLEGHLPGRSRQPRGGRPRADGKAGVRRRGRSGRPVSRLRRARTASRVHHPLR